MGLFLGALISLVFLAVVLLVTDINITQTKRIEAHFPRLWQQHYLGIMVTFKKFFPEACEGA